MIRSLSRVMVAAALCVAITPLTSCATTGATGAVQTPLERAEAAYTRIRGIALMVLPIVPEAYASSIRDGLDKADRALVAARAASSLAEQLIELRKVERATSDVERAASASD
jgi:hypothetical protein